MGVYFMISLQIIVGFSVSLAAASAVAAMAAAAREVTVDRYTEVIREGDNKHHQGVSLLLSRHANDALLGYDCINERFLTAKFQTSVKDLNVICCYAPTEDADGDEKDRFYVQLQDILNSVKKGDITLVLGDFNAKVGTDSDLWGGVIGPFCIGSSMAMGNVSYRSNHTKRSRSNGTIDDLNLLDSFLRNYDRRALPTSRLGIPTVVSTEIYIRSFGSINPSTMDYEADLYLRQKWFDERLLMPNISKPLDLNDPKLVQRIWKPEVFFPNAKTGEFQYVTIPNVLVRIMKTGDILYMLRLKLTFSCMMDLYRFPLDHQVCTIELASLNHIQHDKHNGITDITYPLQKVLRMQWVAAYTRHLTSTRISKTTSELSLQWAEINPITLYEKLKLPQFEIKSINTSLCSEKFHIGEYSCLKAEFHLRRSIGYHLVQSYLPTILIVVISWVSFWLDVESIPARITLGITTLLTISSKSSVIQSSLPPVSYVKAIDVWMGACTTFVFTALLEFTLVNYLWRKRSTAPPPTIKVADENKGLRTPAEDGDSSRETTIPTTKMYGGIHKLSAKRIDHFCRIGFPFLFFLFNVCYWPYYLIV